MKPSLPPWIARQLVPALASPGHAHLLHGPAGLGQYELGLALAHAWLCEQPQHDRTSCGQCPACHLNSVQSHPDLMMLMPEVQMLAMGWPMDERTRKELEDDKKRKPSREIRIDAMRAAIEFCQRTSARGRGRLVLVYPAERMNTITANALLKTLEEPAGQSRIVLCTEAAHAVLPTLRSRCLGHAMRRPQAQEAIDWLVEQGLERSEASALLRASGGQPAQALALHQSGVTAAQWQKLPQAISAGQVQSLAQWSPAQLTDAMQRLCHDLMCQAAGAPARYFDSSDLPKRPIAMARLNTWARELLQRMRTLEHPYIPGLWLEDTVARARVVLNSTQ